MNPAAIDARLDLVSLDHTPYHSPRKGGGSLRREHGKCSARLPSSRGPGVKIWRDDIGQSLKGAQYIQYFQLQ